MEPSIRLWQPQWFLDPVTRLPNRTLFVNRLQTALARPQPLTHRHRSKVAVFAVDVHEFAFIRQRYGRGAAKDLLRTVANRLETCVGPGDTVARFWGGAFAALREVPPSGPSFWTTVERIREALSEEMRLSRSGTIGGPASLDDLALIRLSPRLSVVSAPAGGAVPCEEVLSLAQYGLEIQVHDRRGDGGEPEASFFSVELLEPAFIDIANT